MIQNYCGKSPVLAATVFVEKSAHVIGDVEIGEHSSVWFHAVIRGDVNSIRIGHNSNIQDGSVLHVTTERFSLTIGNHVTMGHRVVAHGCTIRDRCLIGMGAIILDGAVIGEESVVAAGAVVPEGMIVPPRSLVAGVPGKIKRQITDMEAARIAEGWMHYVELKNTYLNQ